MRDIVVCVLLICLLKQHLVFGLEGIIPSEGTVTTASVCYSTRSSHVLACPSNTYQIALTSFYYGFKGNSVGCSNDGTATGSCCEYDSATDCREEASSGTSYMDAFSGRSDGTLATANAAATTCSASTYSAVSVFSELKYQCISDTRIFEMCTSVSYKSTDGSPVYLQNRAYHQGTSILSSDTSCTCSVEVLSASTDTTLYTLHMDLQDDSNNCLQSVTLSDGTSTVKAFDCVTAPFNNIQSESLTGSYFRVSFSNSKETIAGQFWIGFQGSTSTPPINVNCPAVSKIGSTPTPPINVNWTAVPNIGTSSSTGAGVGTVVGAAVGALAVGILIGAAGLFVCQRLIRAHPANQEVIEMRSQHVNDPQSEMDARTPDVHVIHEYQTLEFDNVDIDTTYTSLAS